MKKLKAVLPTIVAFGLSFGSATALAKDDFPSRPLRMVVNSSAGALMDSTARVIAQEMAEILKQPIVVENKPGADGLIGIRYLLSQPADGYTMLISSNTLATLPALRADAGYTLDNLQTVGILATAPFILVGNPEQESKTLADLIKNAKAAPKTLTYASGGTGTSTHMAAALLLNQAGADLLHVPYKGNAAAMPDVIAGRVNMLFDGANTAYPNIKEGRLRAFGISSAERSPSFPEIPTVAEQGYPGFSFEVYFSMTTKAGTPPLAMKKLAEALRQAQQTDAFKKRLQTDGGKAGTLFLGDADAFLKKDLESIKELSKRVALTRD